MNGSFVHGSACHMTNRDRQLLAHQRYTLNYRERLLYQHCGYSGYHPNLTGYGTPETYAKLSATTALSTLQV
ncbi:MAG: hypothetical protein HOM14_03780 [Gammaproteobacteria bacterium]|jgi:hypothetical protein|nr:hypothetical protein [Gammaproteobacteria bacterium]MBT6454204.1 hypothetical protein [Gammaproteobacteria bacterium]MBT6550455.1 hypothetical protein [Gammaproteobacteria bacterium]MBT6703171.1 hypothetical protein [Gammaproteobacteria bacterium]